MGNNSVYPLQLRVLHGAGMPRIHRSPLPEAGQLSAAIRMDMQNTSFNNFSTLPFLANPFSYLLCSLADNYAMPNGSTTRIQRGRFYSPPVQILL